MAFEADKTKSAFLTEPDLILPVKGDSRHMQMQNTTTTSNRNMLTAKELDYIKDYLSWELLAMKKCNDAANACTDMQIKSKIMQTGEKHKQHYETLLTHLH